jgi:GNAT superfamily N-acetyltransferase
MQFRTFDELTPSMDADRILVHLASLGGAADRSAVALWRRRSDVFSEYVGVFAVERGRVVGQTLVKRLAYTFPDGTEKIGAIASVGTRPDLARGGIARKILEEVHRREREAGIRFVSLWTNRSWGAHRLYEKLGYRNVYENPWAVRAPRSRSLPPRRGIRVGPGRRGDLAELERVHDRWAESRLGFCRRPRCMFETSVAVRDFDPAQDLLVARTGGRISGYALAQTTPVRTLCGELVAENQRTVVALVAGVERRAKGTPVAFQHTPVTDHAGMFRQRGYVTLDAGWYVLMAAELDRTWTSRSAVVRFATGNPRFLCLIGDRF